MFQALFSLFSNGFLFFALHLSGGNSFPPPLSAQDERRCLELLAQGDLNAREKLISHNLRLVAHIIKKYYAAAADQEDLISIGSIGLIKAVDSFKADKGARLATYAARCIENVMLISRTCNRHFNLFFQQSVTKLCLRKKSMWKFLESNTS